MIDFLKAVPKWMAALGFFLLVVGAICVTIYSAQTGRTLHLWPEFGFEGKPMELKGWEYTETGEVTNRLVPLPVSPKDGICFLTGVKGKFAGDGEAATVYKSGDTYYVQAGSVAAGSTVTGRAACIKFSETQHNLANSARK